MTLTMDFGTNCRSFLTALDALEKPRLSLLWLHPRHGSVMPGQVRGRLGLAQARETAVLEASLEGGDWAELSPPAVWELGLCQTSNWSLARLPGLGYCLMEEPGADARLRLEPVVKLWTAALKACLLYHLAGGARPPLGADAHPAPWEPFDAAPI